MHVHKSQLVLVEMSECVESQTTDLGTAAAPELNLGSLVKCAAKLFTLAHPCNVIRHTAVQLAANQQKFFACNSSFVVHAPVSGLLGLSCSLALACSACLFYGLVTHADPAVFHGPVLHTHQSRVLCFHFALPPPLPPTPLSTYLTCIGKPVYFVYRRYGSTHARADPRCLPSG